MNLAVDLQQATDNGLDLHQWLRGVNDSVFSIGLRTGARFRESGLVTDQCRSTGLFQLLEANGCTRL